MINELTRKNAHTELDHIFKTVLPAHGMTERPEQTRLSHTMLDAMFDDKIAMSDAGTGVGKTYAYLVAGLVFCHSRRVDGLPFQPVIIATSSIALQNAILREYLPFLSDALADDPHITTPIQAALRKGKSHYVCDKRFCQHLAQRSVRKNTAQEKSLHALQQTLDLDEVPQLSSYDRVRVCVPQNCSCQHQNCRYRQYVADCGRKCYTFQICNHNLWLADCMHRENGMKPIMPDACAVIVDEAHKLPEAAREMFGCELTAGDILQLVFRLKQEQFILAAERLFSSASPLIQKLSEMSAETSLDGLRDDLQKILTALFVIGRKISAHLDSATKRELAQLTDRVVLILRKNPANIKYLEEGDDGKLVIRCVPVDITPLMQRMVWSKQIPLLLTSGTLAIGNSFLRFQEECGLCGNQRVTESILASPFDYASNCRLYFPEKAAHKEGEGKYCEETAQEIIRLFRAANGHALVLFTSYRDMSAVCERIAAEKTGIPIFVMHKDRPRILEQFKSTPGAVLLATGAAWEGIDFPGDCVSLLIIPRLPFAFPDAIHEHEKQNYQTLQDFIRNVIVPEMQIKLRQGFGRAIRRETDTCVVAILDERCGYGGRYHADVLKALPEIPVITQLDDVCRFLYAVKPESYFRSAA